MELALVLIVPRYSIIEKWKCELLEELKQDADMKQFFDDVKIMEPLDAREAFFGGRTNATVLYRKVWLYHYYK